MELLVSFGIEIGRWNLEAVLQSPGFATILLQSTLAIRTDIALCVASRHLVMVWGQLVSLHGIVSAHVTFDNHHHVAQQTDCLGHSR